MTLRLSRYHKPTRSAKAPGKHILVYDGDCHFCSRLAEFLHRRSRFHLTLFAFSDFGEGELLATLEQNEILSSAHYITPDGSEYHGGESVTRAARLLPFGSIAGVLDLWVVSWLREVGYALVASRSSCPKVPDEMRRPPGVRSWS